MASVVLKAGHVQQVAGKIDLQAASQLASQSAIYSR